MYKDHQSRTCIFLKEEDKICHFIPMEIDEGFTVQTMSSKGFYERFKELPGYPVEKACRLFFNYAKSIGATKDVVEYLGHVITISKLEADMATAKSKVVKEAKEKKATPRVQKTSGTTKEKPSAQTKLNQPKKVVKEKSEKKVAGGKDKVSKPSAANMFKELIMAGKLTDGKIFEAVQKEFGLDDSKKGYVKWYRNDMIKKGVKNVPASK